MTTISLNFNKPFILIAKRSNMTVLQIIQDLISNLYFFKLYDEEVETVNQDVVIKDIATIEENLKQYKNDQSVNLGEITFRYLTRLQELKIKDQFSAAVFKLLNQQVMSDWEKELKPLVTFPTQITIQDYGTISLTIDFIMISMLTGFSFEQALQVYIDSYKVEDSSE